MWMEPPLNSSKPSNIQMKVSPLAVASLVAIIILSSLISSCTPKASSDTLSENDARLLVEALEQVARFEPMEELDVPIFFDRAARSVTQAALLSIYFAGEKKRCFESGSKAPFLDCWEKWRESSVVDRSDVDDLVYGLSPWIIRDELELIQDLLPQKIESVVTDKVVKDEQGNPIQDEDGNAVMGRVPSPGAINERDDIVSTVKMRLVNAIRARETFENHRRLLSVIRQLSTQALSWLDINDLEVPAPFNSDTVAPLNETFSITADERLIALLNNEASKVTWDNAAVTWLAMLERKLDRRLAHFGLPVDPEGIQYLRVHNKILTLLEAAQVASVVFEFKRGRDACSFDTDTRCSLHRDDEAILGEVTGFKPIVRHRPIIGLNKLALFGLAKAEQVRVTAERDSVGVWHWVATSRASLSLEWELLRSEDSGTGVIETELLDFNANATEVEARSSSDNPGVVSLSSLSTWNFWPVSRMAVLAWFKGKGLPAYLDVSEIALERRANSFVIAAEASLKPLGGAEVASVPFSVALNQSEDIDLDRFWRSVTAKLIGETATWARKCKKQCTLLTSNLPRALASGFELTDIAIRTIEPLQLRLLAYPRGKSAVEFSFNMTLDSDGGWRLDSAGLESEDTLLAAQLSEPDQEFRNNQAVFWQAKSDLTRAIANNQQSRDLLADPVMLDKLMSRVTPAFSIDEALSRALVASTVMSQQQAVVIDELASQLQAADHPIRAFAREVTRHTYQAPADVTSVLAVPNSDSPVMVKAHEALLAALVHDYRVAGGQAANARELVERWIEDAVNFGVNQSIEQRWLDESSFACLESPSGCPMPALTETSALLSVYEYLAIDPNLFTLGECDALVGSIETVSTRRLPILMVCASQFGISEGDFNAARESFVTALNQTVQDALEDNWQRYRSRVKARWQQIEDASPDQMVGAALTQHLAEQMPRVNESQLEGLTRDLAMVAVEAERIEQFDMADQTLENSIRSATAHRIESWVSEAAEDEVLSPAFTEVLEGRPVDEILSTSTADTTVLKTLKKAQESERAFFDSRAAWIKQVAPDNVLVRNIQVNRNNDQVTVSAQLLPDVNASVSLRYPSEARAVTDAAATLLTAGVDQVQADATLQTVRSAVNRIQQSASRLEQTFDYERRQVDELLQKNLGDAYADYLKGCSSYVADDDMCRDPEYFWKVVTGRDLADWPLEIMVKLTDAIDTAPGMAREELLAAGRSYLDTDLAGRCQTIADQTVEGIAIEISDAISKSCSALIQHLTDNLEQIVDECAGNLMRSEGETCVDDLHEVAINEFAAAIEFDNKLEQAAWTYVLEQAVVLNGKLAGLPEWVLQPPVACIDEMNFSISLSEPGQCGDGIEISNVSAAQLYLADLRKQWRALQGQVEAHLENVGTLCIKTGDNPMNLPTVSVGQEGCTGVVVNSSHSAKEYFKNASEATIAQLNRELDEQLNRVCINTLTDAGIRMLGDAQCISLEELKDPSVVESRVSKIIENSADELLAEVADDAIERMQGLAASYGVEVVIVDDQYCVDTSIFGLLDLQCEDDLAALQQYIADAWEEITSFDVDRLTALATEQAERRALAIAGRELAIQCGRFREALANSDLSLFGAALELDFNGNECPDKAVRVTGTAVIDDVTVNVSAGLRYEGKGLVLDWQQLQTNPTPEALIERLIERELEDVEVLSADLSSAGVSVRIRYMPAGFPWPVEAIAELGDASGLELDLNYDFDRIWSSALVGICSEIGSYVRDERLEVLPGAVIAGSFDDYCVSRKLQGLKFQIDAEFAEPFGSQMIFVVVDSRAGISIEAPNFRDLLAQNLANFLKVANVGVTPANPWYTTGDGLTLHLDVNLPIPVIELKAKTSLSISPKRIEFKSPVRLRVDQWIDTATVSFGRFELGYEPKGRRIELAGSATVVPGEVNHHIFQVDGSATFNIEDEEILLQGSSRVATILEVSNTTTRINFANRLFEHSVSSGPMLSDVIRMEGSLKVQDHPGVDFIRAKGTGDLFGARVASMSIGLGRRLDGEFNVYLNFLDVAKQRFLFKVDQYFSNPRVETSVIGMSIGSLTADVHVSANSRNARVTLEVLGQKISQDVASLAEIDEDLLEQLLKPDFSLRIGSLESGATLISLGDDLPDGDGDEDADDPETDGPQTGDEVAVDLPPVEGDWNNAFRVERRVEHYKDCWKIRFLFRADILCKKRQRVRYDKIVEESTRGVASDLGLNSFTLLKSRDAKYRQLKGSHLLQFAYKEKGDGAPHLVVYDQQDGQIVWRGTYGCEGTNCYCFDTRVPTGLPALQPVHYLREADSSYLLVKADAGASIFGMVGDGSPLADARCLTRSSSAVIEEVSQRAGEFGDKAAVGLYKLVLREGALRGRNLNLSGYGDYVDPSVLELKSEDHLFLLHYDPVAPDFYWFLEMPRRDTREARSFLLDRFESTRATLDEICKSSSQKGLNLPCAFSRFARDSEGDTFAIIERGVGQSERKLALIPEQVVGDQALRADLEVKGKLERLLNDGDIMTQLFDSFIVGLSPQTIRRVVYSETTTGNKRELWLANYLDSSKEKAIKIADSGVTTNQGKPLIASRRWSCLKSGIDAFPGVAPSDFRKNWSAEQFADLLIEDYRGWKELGWKANPLGYMNLNCQ